MDDNREHPNPKQLDELVSAGLGQGRLIEAGQLFEERLSKATGFEVKTNIYHENKLSVVLRIAKDKIAPNAAQFSFELFPGNHDIVVSTGAYVEDMRRGLGLGYLLLRTRLTVARAVGFQLFMCTVERNNEKQKSQLRQSGFSEGTVGTATAAIWYKKL